MSKRYKAKRLARFYRRQRRCQHPGCTNEGLECHLSPPYDQEGPEYFCGMHAAMAGYCRGCGQFWGGIESFDSGPHAGWCDHCWDQVEADFGEPEEDEFAFGYAEMGGRP
jgi:hypothetical protein